MAAIITETQFQELVLDASQQKPILVDFFAEWCMPCKMMAPILDDLTNELGDSVGILKVDVDNERNLASQFGIMSIPTMYMFRNGKIVDKIIGLRNPDDLRTLFEKHK